jgi:signal transduction histidine kinase
MTRRKLLQRYFALSFCFGTVLVTPCASLGQASADLQIQSVSVNGKARPVLQDGEVNLGCSPQRISIAFGAVSNAAPLPLRLRSKLEGVDAAWRQGGGEMYFVIRFCNENGDRVGQESFMVQDDSSGWNGSLETSKLTHRREIVTVPAGASRVWVIISSAGPPSTTGIYVVDDISISRVSTNGYRSEVLLHPPFDHRSGEASDTQPPQGWCSDGTHPSMAKIVEIGKDPKIRALAIEDDDRFGHAEWRTVKEFAPQVSPNDHLLVEWNEMYSIGEAALKTADYDTLPPGLYHFRVEDVSIFGKPTGVSTELTVRVPMAVWHTPWFWPLIAAFTVGVSAWVVRYVARQKLQRTMTRLRQQHMLEQERLRIAQDIHDDLGARVTQISLLCAMAEEDSGLSDKVRGRLERISVISRELVSALYETVWAVNPENDNLDAMVNYLCEKFNEFCQQARLRCRLNVSTMPKNVEISSRSRHNISMASKEAMHNVVKHANASQVTIHIAFQESTLTILIQDDGGGFRLEHAPSGNGLVNMKRRMEDIGGICTMESEPGKGTVIRLRLVIAAQSNDRSSSVPQERFGGQAPSPELQSIYTSYEKNGGHR